MPAKAAREVEHVELRVIDAVLGKCNLQAGDIGALGLGQRVDVAFVERDRLVAVRGDDKVGAGVLEAPEGVHAAGAEQLAEQVHEAGAAEALGGAAADDRRVHAAVVADDDLLDGARQAGHAEGDLAALEGRAGGARGGEHLVLVADDELGVGADVHHGDEALLVHAGLVLEGGSSNFFAVIDGELRTCPVGPILPGVTRARVIQLLAGEGVKTHETPIALVDLERASEAFVTSSIRGVMPVASIDGRGLAVPGPLAARAAALYADFLLR